ncbi:hypothetical protein K439DRAFT_1623946 [Ramaria rubella]|nr:hypothetical protein K439DRAFT_1623946 [Ramaria rubella]
MSTPTAGTKVFVHDGIVFLSPNTTFLPVVPPKPLPDPDYIDPMSYVHPHKMCAMQWSYNVFPYLAYIPAHKIDFHFEGFMSLPTIKGYLQTHQSPELAEKWALISCDASVPLMAMCSMAIALYSFTPPGGLLKLHWLKYLTKTMKPPPHLVWLKNIEQSPIARLDLLYPQVGIIIDVISCQYLNWVTVMMAHNIPIWFYWRKVDSPLANLARKDICAHRPTPGQICLARNASTLPMDADAVALVHKEQQPDPKSHQQLGKRWQDFFIREEQQNTKIEVCEDEKAKQAWLQRQANASHPGRRGAHVYVWMDADGFLVDNWWDNFKLTQRHYNGFVDKWDLCEDFDPSTPVHTWQQYNAALNDEIKMDDVMSMDNISAADPQETVPSSFSDIIPMPHSDSYIEYLSTFFGHTEPLVHFQLPPKDTLVSIYNHLGISMPDVDLSDYKGLLDNDLLWERMQIYLTLNRGEIEDMMFRVAIWRVRGKEKPLYVLHPLTPIPEGHEWILSVNDAATVLETLWHEFSSRDAVARYYISKGILFKMVMQLNKLSFNPLLPHFHDIGLSWQPISYRPTAVDYAAYEVIHREFFCQPHARVALMYGGIVWHLAVEHICLESVLIGPTDEVFRKSYGQMVNMNIGMTL